MTRTIDCDDGVATSSLRVDGGAGLASGLLLANAGFGVCSSSGRDPRVYVGQGDAGDVGSPSLR